ncbi:MAG: transcription elongation factor GreA [Candidatus Beckwithbacteria bacterium]|nr:transcription elongation factor GreA [Candidatus Beckwithbacteria bacterium]
MPQQDFYLTPEGLKELKEELKVLVEEKKPALLERVATARSHGDLSENSEYAAAREDLAFVEGRIEEIETLVVKAKIIKSKKTDEVKLGSLVTVKTNGSTQTFELVGEWEADPLKQKISHTSPLGQALLGKKKGDKVEIKAPAGKVIYQIHKIE